MTLRTALATSLAALLLPALGSGAAAAAPDRPIDQSTAQSTGHSAAAAMPRAKCLGQALTKRKAVRSRSGAKLGTARLFSAKAGSQRGFCVRLKPTKRLRKRTTIAEYKYAWILPSGHPGGSGMRGGSGYWRTPFLLTGTDFETGAVFDGTVRLYVPGGQSGSVRLKGTQR